MVSLIRGLFRRCPRCGSSGIFRSWFHLEPSCPSCHLDFEREPGWWIGGMIINTAASLIVLFSVGALGMFLWWPDVPWTALTVTSMVAMAVFPIVFYPMSKTVWLAVDLLMSNMDPTARK